MNRKKIISIVILFALAILNTGCIQKYFYNDKDIKKKVEEKEVLLNTTNQTSSVECIDEIKPEKNNCDRGIISTTEGDIKPKQEGEKYTFNSIRGKTINIIKTPRGYDFTEYRGKVIILEMFGKDCPHCINQLPIIKKIRRKYRGRLEVIAIQSQDRMSKFVARDYINRYEIKYPIVEGEDAVNLQRDVQEQFEWTGILPYTLIIKDGMVNYFHAGEVSFEKLDRDISEII
jgi:thiol-disulfide isomerase/thioredoxin